jgi:hypothetical protein
MTSLQAFDAISLLKVTGKLGATTGNFMSRNQNHRWIIFSQ